MLTFGDRMLHHIHNLNIYIFKHHPQDHTCAIIVGGIVKCWGFNEIGQVIRQILVYQLHPVDYFQLGLSILTEAVATPTTVNNLGLAMRISLGGVSLDISGFQINCMPLRIFGTVSFLRPFVLFSVH
jgi:hypothetical protein